MTNAKLPRLLFVSDNPGGGAGIAALRLYEELKRSGADVRFLVFQQPFGTLAGWNRPLDLEQSRGLVRKCRKFIGMAKEVAAEVGRWCRGWRRDRFFHGVPDRFEITTIYPGAHRLEEHPWFAWAEVIHLHWTAGFLSPRQQWTAKPWVVSLHDAYPFTAVCHFPDGCRQFQTGCRDCPQLACTKNPHRSGKVFQRKMAGYGKAPRMTLHAPSRWIADLASQSQLTKALPSVVLPNVFPTEVFRPLNPAAARELLGLPGEKKLALYVAASLGNHRKGASWFFKLAETLRDSGWEFVVVGGGELAEVPSNVHLLGRLGDLRLMAAAYSAADLFVSTTLQDTVPATVVEAQLCGTPVIGFEVGGQPEMIQADETGYLDSSVGLEGLVRGVQWFETRQPSRELIAAYALGRWEKARVVADWIDFYRRIR